MIKVLVTGAGGQLGKCLQKIANLHPTLEIIFMDSKELDITNIESVNQVFETANFDYCINCAAYTNVDQAEQTPDKAFKINAEGVKNIALACKRHNTFLIHISTDYVFDGEKKSPYTVNDIPNPINQYGKSKLLGEKYVQDILVTYYIIRSSWLYSEFGNNFYKTILEKAKNQEVLHVTDQQLGCPTNANNLAIYILGLIKDESTFYGVHHFTDGEALTWYGFAKRILKENNLEGKVKLSKAKNYRTFARRPSNSILL